MATAPPSLPADIFGVFSGPINAETTKNLMNNLTGTTSGGVQRVHLMFHTTGGFVSDGVCLFNFLKTFPVDLTLYNGGAVSSIGVIAYLGAKHRKASAHSVFMIHRTQCGIPAGTPANRAQTIVDSALLDDRRTEVILRENLTLPDERWVSFENDDLHFSAQEAVEYGIADEIADFAPPPGARIWNF
jgi:ATP-dependent Clp protease protease subunit